MRKNLDLINIMCLGDADVGKTGFLASVFKDPEEIDFDNMPIFSDNNTLMYNEDIQMELWDVTYCFFLDRIRAIYYRLADVILLFYACDQPDTFFSIEETWLPQIERDAKGKPIILCAAKYDLRQDPTRNCVDISQAYDLMKKHSNIVGVIQNSAQLRYQIKETLDMCVHALTNNSIAPFSGCQELKKGEIAHVYYKEKCHVAKIRKVTKNYVEVFFIKRPFWWNKMKIKHRDDIEPFPLSLTLQNLFADFFPFGLEIPESAVGEISEYLPEGGYWSWRKVCRMNHIPYDRKMSVQGR